MKKENWKTFGKREVKSMNLLHGVFVACVCKSQYKVTQVKPDRHAGCQKIILETEEYRIVFFHVIHCPQNALNSSIYENRQMEGPSWVRNILLTCCIYCGPLLAVFSVNNTVAIFYRVGALSQASDASGLWSMLCGCCIRFII